MPGFDIATSHSHTSRMRDARAWFGAFGAAAVAGVGVGMVDVSVLPDMSQFGAFGVALAAAVVGGLILAGKVRGVHERLRAELTEHRLPITHQLRVPPAKPVKENKLDDGRVVPARGGGYAFDHRAFLVGQEIPVSVSAPHAGNASGKHPPPSVSQRFRDVIWAGAFGGAQRIKGTCAPSEPVAAFWLTEESVVNLRVARKLL